MSFSVPVLLWWIMLSVTHLRSLPNSRSWGFSLTFSSIIEILQLKVLYLWLWSVVPFLQMMPGVDWLSPGGVQLSQYHVLKRQTVLCPVSDLFTFLKASRPVPVDLLLSSWFCSMDACVCLAATPQGLVWVPSWEVVKSRGQPPVSPSSSEWQLF